MVIVLLRSSQEQVVRGPWPYAHRVFRGGGGILAVCATVKKRYAIMMAIDLAVGDLACLFLGPKWIRRNQGGSCKIAALQVSESAASCPKVPENV